MSRRVIAVGLFVALAVSGCGESGSKDGSATSSSTPSASTSSSESPSASSSAAAGQDLSLDTAGHPSGTPLWGFTAPQGWKTTMLDKQGYNQAKGSNGCQVTTYQAKIQDKVTSVRKGSENLTRNYAAALQQKVPKAKVNGSGSMVFPGGAGKSKKPARVEFTWARVDYPQNDGTKFSSVIASRAFTSPDTALQMVYSCPTGKIGDRSATFRAMQRSGAVVFD